MNDHLLSFILKLAYPPGHAQRMRKHMSLVLEQVNKKGSETGGKIYDYSLHP